MRVSGQSVSLDDFEAILQSGFSQTTFNGLPVGGHFELRSEEDPRILFMEVEEITYYADGKPCLSISKVLHETFRQHQRKKIN